MGLKLVYLSTFQLNYDILKLLTDTIVDIRALTQILYHNPILNKFHKTLFTVRASPLQY